MKQAQFLSSVLYLTENNLAILLMEQNKVQSSSVFNQFYTYY